MPLDLTVYPCQPIPVSDIRGTLLARLQAWDPRILPDAEVPLEPYGPSPLTARSSVALEVGACLLGSLAYQSQVSVISTFDVEEGRWSVMVEQAHRSNRSLALMLAAGAVLAELGRSDQVEDLAQAFGLGEEFPPAAADEYVRAAFARWPGADPGDAIAWSSRRSWIWDRPPPDSGE